MYNHLFEAFLHQIRKEAPADDLALAEGTIRRKQNGASLMTLSQITDLTICAPACCHALRLTEKAARHDWPVLLVDESGTGKGLFAQSIHVASRRATGPFVTLNCDMIPKDLIAHAHFILKQETPLSELRGCLTPRCSSRGTICVINASSSSLT